MHSFMFWTSADTEKGIQEKKTQKRLNHLMSVFNDAWRYLDLCSWLASLWFLTFLKTENTQKNEKRKQKKGQNTNFDSTWPTIVFRFHFSCPRPGKTYLRLYHSPCTIFHYFLSLLQSRRLKINNVKSHAINQTSFRIKIHFLHSCSFVSLLS